MRCSAAATDADILELTEENVEKVLDEVRWGRLRRSPAALVFSRALAASHRKPSTKTASLPNAHTLPPLNHHHPPTTQQQQQKQVRPYQMAGTSSWSRSTAWW
jgi:hypothetical protein